MSTEQIRKTLRAYQRAVTAEPTNVDLRRELARYLAALGYTRQAAQELELCAKLLAARGELIAAIACSKRLLKLDPGRTDILLFLTRHYAEHGAPGQPRPGSVAVALDPPARQPQERHPRVDHDRTPPQPARALHSGDAGALVDTADGDAEAGPSPPAPTTATAPPPHEAATRVVRMPVRDPGLESIELTVVSLGDDDHDIELLTAPSPPLVSDTAPSVEILEPPSGVTPAPPHVVRVEIPNTLPLDVPRPRPPTIPLFSSLSAAAFLELLEHLEHRTCAAGTLLDADGDGEDEPCLEILVEGRLRAWWTRDDGHRVELGPIPPGGFFGESALVEDARGERRTRRGLHLQIEVLEDSQLLVLPRRHLDALCDVHPSIRPRLLDLHHKRLVRDFLAASELFDTLSVTDRELLARQMRPRALAPGEVLGRRGEPSEGLYLVRDGCLEYGRDARTGTLGPGDFFGIHSLFAGSLWLNTLRAVEPTTLLVLDAAALAPFLDAHPGARRALEAVVAQQPIEQD